MVDVSRESSFCFRTAASGDSPSGTATGGAKFSGGAGGSVGGLNTSGPMVGSPPLISMPAAANNGSRNVNAEMPPTTKAEVARPTMTHSAIRDFGIPTS